MKRRLTLVAAALLQCTMLRAGDGPQLYNMSFDHWSKVSGAWMPYAKGASEKQKIWDSANKGLSILGVNGTQPEYRHLAVEGEGKAAARITSTKVLWAFVAGNIYTGQFIRVVNFSGAEMTMGVPFTARPRSLSGYFHYIPGKINFVKAPYGNLKGTTDRGRIEVILTDWDKQYHINSNDEEFIDAATDPHVIGHGELIIESGTDGYVRFDIPIEYRSAKTPSYVSINAASSYYGAYFTGASGSVLYLDELKFNY